MTNGRITGNFRRGARPPGTRTKDAKLGDYVRVKEAAILDHDVPHYRGEIGRVSFDTGGRHVAVRWRGWTSMWQRDELEKCERPAPAA